MASATASFLLFWQRHWFSVLFQVREVLPRLVQNMITKIGIPGPAIGPGLPVATARFCASKGSVMRSSHGERHVGPGHGVLPSVFPHVPVVFRILEDDNFEVEGVL